MCYALDVSPPRSISDFPVEATLAELTFAVKEIDTRSLQALARVIDTTSSADLIAIRAAASRALVTVHKLGFWLDEAREGPAVHVPDYMRLVDAKTKSPDPRGPS